jgi:CSLREA domain-containing protein
VAAKVAASAQQNVCRDDLSLAREAEPQMLRHIGEAERSTRPEASSKRRIDFRRPPWNSVCCSAAAAEVVTDGEDRVHQTVRFLFPFCDRTELVKEAPLNLKLTLGLAASACALILPNPASPVPGTTITVNTTADGTGAPECTLRDAITAANTDTVAGGCNAGHGADAIDFSVSGQISLGSTLPAVASDLTIDGSSQSIIVSGQGAVRVLEVRAGASLTLAVLTIADGDAKNAGGILNSGTLLITNSTLSGNTAEGFGSGGGIWNTVGGMLVVGNSSFSENGGETEHVTLGAGIYNDGWARVENSTFSDNDADHGGGINNGARGRLKVEASTFSGNTAGEGGGINNRGRLSIENSAFFGNNGTDGVAGGISNRDAITLTVANSTFSGNCAPQGGGIANGASLTVANSTFSENCADGGGAIYNMRLGTLAVADSTFSDNVALSGAAIDWFGSGTIRRSAFAGNIADDGGGINGGGTLTVSNSTFSGNTAASGGFGRGGGIFNRLEGRLTVKSSTFSGNSAGEGGGIASLGAATLENTIVAGSTQGGNCSGAFATASTHNMSDDATCSPGFTQVALADLMLGPLAENGGLTQTIALGSGSVAIDAGNNAAAAGLITDQRGRDFRRIVHGRVDIGAFEVQRRRSGPA